MAVDYKEYSDAMDYMFEQLEKIKNEKSQEIGTALIPICRTMRIAAVSIDYYENLAEEQAGAGVHHLYYEAGPQDPDRVLRYRGMSANNTVGLLTAYQFMDDTADWDEEEQEKIVHILKMAYAFMGRAKVMNIAEYMSFHDMQLRIWNLPYFLMHLNKVIAQKQIGRYCACYFNLRHYAVINYQIGRDNADVVMKRFIDGLENMFEKDELVARIGGDNFALLFNKDKIDFVLKYLNGTEISYSPDENPVRVVASAGYYMIPDDCKLATLVMDNVSVAVNLAKASVNERYVFFDDRILKTVSHSKMIQERFPKALAAGEFKVFYQPKVDLHDYSLAGAEALCRWFREDEVLPPAAFIETFERNKYICLLDFYMLEQVCADIRKWLDEGLKVVPVSVNFSRAHFGNTRLLENIVEVIDRYKVPHKYIQIELTETTTDVDYEELRKLVYGLYDNQISTAVDDFGTGYSSLNIIKDLPWTTLKIDKSFLGKNDKTNNYNHSLLKHIVSMAKEIGLECIVEGVETLGHIDILKTNGCYLAQGYYFDKPMPKYMFEEIVRRK